jgi:glycosyltransferase involved in cell wall biosynthesis
VRNRNLSKQVRFAGFIPETDLPRAYRAADLSVVPSQTLEGFGLTVLESLACGTPVLVTPVGGLPEVIKPLNPGLVLPDKGAAAIADRLHLFLSGALSIPSGDDCRKYVESNFSLPTIAQRVKTLYWQVARG